MPASTRSRNFAIGLLVIGPALQARAATITVDTTVDTTLSACTAAASDCSLRGAITAANNTPAADTIAFDIPQTDPGFQSTTQHWLIGVPDGQMLPTPTAPLIIDGYTQPGAQPNSNTPDEGGLNAQLKIEVRGSNPAGNANYAFQLTSDNTIVLRGLAIGGYRDAQVFLQGNGAHRIEGCFLGTDINGTHATLISGTQPQGNGVVLAGPGAYVLGGTSPDQRNLISGLNFAISTSGSALPALRMQGNLVGTNAAGDAVIGNSFALLAFRFGNTLIGGNTANARNVFSGARGQAMLFRANIPGVFASTIVQGNYFGTDVSGARALGNDYQRSGTSIEISNIGCALNLGGLAPGEANLIAFSESAGVAVFGCNGMRNELNRYVGNRGLAFDNAAGNNTGPTTNDVDDADTGSNRLQNSPEIELPQNFLPGGDGTVTLQYRVDSATTHAAYPITINFYRAACGGGSGELIGSDVYGATDAQLLREFTLTSADGANVLPLVANAIDAQGNTSEFSTMFGDEVFHAGFEEVNAPAAIGACR